MLTILKHNISMAYMIKAPVSAHWKSGARVMSTLVSSIASLGSTCALPTLITYPHDSEWAALRGDWLRIGADMGEVMRRHGDRGKEPR